MNLEYDPAELGNRAWEFTQRLVREVGPRPAGGAGDAAARHWVGQLAVPWGLRVVDLPFSFPPQPRFFPYYTLLGAGFLLAAACLPYFPLLCLLLAPFSAGLPLISDALLACLPRSAHSANLLLLPADSREEDLDLILCAHLDSARSIPLGPPAARRMLREIDDAAFRLGLILAALACFPLFGLGLAPALRWAAVGVAGVLFLLGIALDAWQQLGDGGQYTPGATDNASGVGVVLALAEVLAARPSSSLTVGFLFTAAEEAGLYGAQAYAQRLAHSGRRPYVVNLDMLSPGDGLRLVTQSGPLFPVRSDAGLNAWLQRAAPEMRLRATARRSSDFAAFARQKIPAAWIEGAGSSDFWQVYHTRDDLLGVVDPAQLERAGEALAHLVYLLERDKSGRMKSKVSEK